ncbi:hypothetical protein [Halalkalicoccus salilacus]|uniref:hypothetical protein n=1 Tax=Halalkalicoccus salilacus TaxID=3117459 RepID=UPI00300EC64B
MQSPSSGDRFARADESDARFFSNHVLGEVEAICDRIGILNDGRLVATGTPGALRSDLDLGASIRVEVARVPDDLALEAMDGVESVAIQRSTVVASLADSTAKIEVISELDERTQVLDVVSETTSLERLFNTYTSSGREEPLAAGSGTDVPRMEAGR